MNRRIAVIVRAQDGVLQPAVIGARAGVSVYRLTGCVLRAIGCGGPASAIQSICEVAADAFVFVNAPLETINHMCIETLTAHALKEDRGLVWGTILDKNGHLLERTETYLFSVRRERLLRAGGLAPVSAYRMRHLFEWLRALANEEDLECRRTPHAIAVLASSYREA
jgi:hypothetical protein